MRPQLAFGFQFSICISALKAFEPSITSIHPSAPIQIVTLTKAAARSTPYIWRCSTNLPSYITWNRSSSCVRIETSSPVPPRLSSSWFTVIERSNDPISVKAPWASPTPPWSTGGGPKTSEIPAPRAAVPRSTSIVIESAEPAVFGIVVVHDRRRRPRPT